MASREEQRQGLAARNDALEVRNRELSARVDELDRAHADLASRIESSPVGTVFLDGNLRVQRFTPPAADALHLVSEDIGRPLAEIVPRFDGELPVADIEAVLAGGEPVAHDVVARRAAGGREAHFLLQIDPYRRADGTIDGIVLNLIDVSESKRNQLRKAWLAAIVESSDDAIISKGLDGVIRSWNEGAERMYGYTEAEAVGRPIGLIVPDERREELREIMENLARGEKVQALKTKRLAKSGRLLSISLTVSPMFDDDGEIIGASAVAHDVTDLREAEERLRRADERKDRFLATLGHELRNPLMPIRNAVGLLRSPRAGPELRRRAEEILDHQSLHLARIVDDLLEVARITRGAMRFEKEPVELVELTVATADAQRPGFRERGLELVTHLPDEPLIAMVDPTRYNQMLGNLLDNAGKFTQRGGRVEVGLRMVDDGETVELSVEDDGIGIAAEHLDTLFEEFSGSPAAGASRPNGNGNGLGLGLVVVRRVAEMHGGGVVASSPGPGEGARFVVRLPLGTIEEAGSRAAAGGGTKPFAPVAAGYTLRSAPTAARDAGRRAAPRRVLVIEDNVDAAESIAELLRLDGHEVIVAHDGAEGLEAVRSFAPEVVLCDIGLPGELDGLAVARQIRQGSVEPPVLMAMTGYGQQQDIDRSRRAGFDRHLTKPVDLDLLRRVMSDSPRERAS